MIEVALADAVDAWVGENLDEERRDALDIEGSQDVQLMTADEDDVRLEDVHIGKDDVRRGDEDPSATVFVEVSAEPHGKAEDDVLMVEPRGRGHEKLAVDELAAQPIVRE